MDDEPAWLDLDDAELPLEELNARYSVLLRWPDWRVLHQDKAWIDRDRQVHALGEMTPEQVRTALLELGGHAAYLHAQAAQDESYATSTGLAWALRQLGVRPVGAHHPLVWLDATPLVRALRARARRLHAESRDSDGADRSPVRTDASGGSPA